MVTGSKTVNRTQEEVHDRLRILLAAANCDVLEDRSDCVRFRHGTAMTETASMLPKEALLRITSHGDATHIDYEIRPVGFAPAWLFAVAVLFCWLIFPPILAHRALVYHPRRFIENLLAGL